MAGAMVQCDGRCEGNFEPPTAKAECQASAKAEAKLNVECTPPRIALEYQLAGNLNAEASARFRAALGNLEVRLPALLAALARAEIVIDAGAGLIADAGGAVEAGVTAAAGAAAQGDVAVGLGLACAIEELPAIGGAIGGASGRLQASLTAAGELTSSLGV
jgi:hypothetical protein